MFKIKSITLNTIELEDMEIGNETLAQYVKYDTNRDSAKNIVTL